MADDLGKQFVMSKDFKKFQDNMAAGFLNIGKVVTREHWPNTSWGSHIDEDGNRVPNKPPPKKIKRVIKSSTPPPRKVRRP